jgi:hypothetical protein
MNTTQDTLKDVEESHEQPLTNQNEETSDEQEVEFKVSVRKLELPVRPRGVLAE